MKKNSPLALAACLHICKHFGELAEDPRRVITNSTGISPGAGMAGGEKVKSCAAQMMRGERSCSTAA